MKITNLNIIRLFLYLSLFASAIFMFSCSDSTSPENQQGRIKITLADGPGDYEHVNIAVTRVEVHKAGPDSSSGWFVINNNAETYDLLTLRNGASAVLGNTSLDAGQYSQIRLIIGNGSNVVAAGVAYLLEIPSGEQTGVKLNHSFEINSGQLYELILDFDADRSIIVTGNGKYKLKPVIRIVPVVISGTISGSINPVTAAGYASAINGTDTVATIADPITGSFKLMALLQQSYRIEILSANPAYNDTTITNVMVTAEQNTDLETITLHLK